MLEVIQSLLLGACVVMVIWHHVTLKEMAGEHEMRCDTCAEIGTCPAAYSWNVKFPCAAYRKEESENEADE